jgi:hypothetical protein
VPYYGQADPAAFLPRDLDVVFIATYEREPSPTRRAALAGDAHRLGDRTRGARRCLSFFDVVVGECDRNVVAESSATVRAARSQRSAADRRPSVEERLPEIARRRSGADGRIRMR